MKNSLCFLTPFRSRSVTRGMRDLQGDYEKGTLLLLLLLCTCPDTGCTVQVKIHYYYQLLPHQQIQFGNSNVALLYSVLCTVYCTV